MKRFLLCAAILGTSSVFASEPALERRKEEIRKFGKQAYYLLKDINRRNVPIVDDKEARVDIDPEKFVEIVELLQAPDAVAIRPVLTRRVFRNGSAMDETLSGRNYPAQLGRGLALELNEGDLLRSDDFPSPKKEISKLGFYFHEIFSILEGDPMANRDSNHEVTKSFLMAARGGITSGGGDIREVERIADMLATELPSASGPSAVIPKIDELGRTLVGVSKCQIQGYNHTSPGYSFTVSWVVNEEVDNGGGFRNVRKSYRSQTISSGKIIETTSEIQRSCRTARAPYVQQFKTLHPDRVPVLSGVMKFNGNGFSSGNIFNVVKSRTARAKKDAEDTALAACRAHPQIDASTCKIVSPGTLTTDGVDLSPMGLASETYARASAVAQGSLLSPVEQLEEDLIAF